MLDHRAQIFHVGLRSVMGWDGPGAFAVAAKIQRDDPSQRRELRRHQVPPMGVRCAAVQQYQGMPARIAAPVQVMELQTVGIEETAGRLRRSGGRSLGSHMVDIVVDAQSRG